MPKALKPCPFCGGSNIDASGWASEGTTGPACDDCGGSVGSCFDPENANVAAWNRRVAPLLTGKGGLGSLPERSAVQALRRSSLPIRSVVIETTRREDV